MKREIKFSFCEIDPVKPTRGTLEPKSELNRNFIKIQNISRQSILVEASLTLFWAIQFLYITYQFPRKIGKYPVWDIVKKYDFLPGNKSNSIISTIPFWNILHTKSLRTISIENSLRALMNRASGLNNWILYTQGYKLYWKWYHKKYCVWILLEKKNYIHFNQWYIILLMT